MTKSAVATRPQTKRTVKKTAAILSTCPINGAGWCPYPFSPAQLEKHLKHKAETVQPTNKTKKQNNN
jgi:hypothetical protein